MSKQDRQGVRKASDIEQKYDLSQLSNIGGMRQHQNEMLSQINQTVSQFITSINGRFDELQNKILSNYAVGSMYLSLDNTNPTKFIGGTWELFSEGYLLFGLDPESETTEILHTLDKCYVWKRTA